MQQLPFPFFYKPHNHSIQTPCRLQYAYAPSKSARQGNADAATPRNGSLSTDFLQKVVEVKPKRAIKKSSVDLHRYLASRNTPVFTPRLWLPNRIPTAAFYRWYHMNSCSPKGISSDTSNHLKATGLASLPLNLILLRDSGAQVKPNTSQKHYVQGKAHQAQLAHRGSSNKWELRNKRPETNSSTYSRFSFPCTTSQPHNQRGAPSTLAAEQGSLCSQVWGQQESQHWYNFFFFFQPAYWCSRRTDPDSRSQDTVWALLCICCC